MALDHESPKDRFLKDKLAVEAHRTLVSNSQFIKSLEKALLQYQHEAAIRSSNDLNAAAAAQFMVTGAHQFAQLLKNLSEMPEHPKPQTYPQLHPQ